MLTLNSHLNCQNIQATNSIYISYTYIPSDFFLAVATHSLLECMNINSTAAAQTIAVTPTAIPTTSPVLLALYVLSAPDSK